MDGCFRGASVEEEKLLGKLIYRCVKYVDYHEEYCENNKASGINKISIFHI